MIDETIGRLAAGEDLSPAEMGQAMEAILDGRCRAQQIALFLTGLCMKGETAEEIAAAATALRRRMTTIKSRWDELIDTCGTGGDGSGTFNISTAAALVIAAAGTPVAKHGNRRVTSRSGSADVLAALGVNVEANVAVVEQCLDELGICFCFAPLLHGSMKQVAQVRRELEIPTIFNLLGPLTNPAGACYQVVGVGDLGRRQPIADALAMLGTKRSLVVSGDDGLDEVSLATATQVTEVGGIPRSFSWRPEDFGVDAAPLDVLQVSGPEESAAIIRQVLTGERGLARDIVVMNAAAALYTAGGGANPRQGALQASAAIDSGAAHDLLERLIRLSNA